MLMGVIGELGSGKTLGMTYMGIRNYVKYEGTRTIFANYHLFDVPFNFVDSPEQIDDIHSGIFLADELWLWLDSRVSSSKRNRFVSAILAKSRKRDLDILYTSQSFSQVDKRVRKITDFVAVPSHNEASHRCTIRIYTNPAGDLIKILKFNAIPIYELYDTTEEIKVP